MKILTKSLLSAGAAAAALVSVAAPAQARDRRDNDGISAGEVVAGAVILGGLAAVISASGNDRDRYDDRGYDPRNGDGRYDNGRYSNNGYNNGGNSRAAITQCISQAESWAGRYSRSDVTKVTDVDRTRNGYRVKGNIVVRDGWRGNDRNGRYDRGNNYNNGYARGYDKGSFTCTVERGRVVDVRYSGLDRWR